MSVHVLALLLAHIKYHQNSIENQPFPYQYLPLCLLTVFSFGLRYIALQPDYRHQQNQSYLDRLLKDIVNSILAPYEPLHRTQKYHHAGGIFLKLHQQFWPIFYGLYSKTHLNRTCHKAHVGALVLSHLARLARLEKQLQTSNNRCRPISFPLQYL